MRIALSILLIVAALASGYAGQQLRERAVFEDPLPPAPNPALGKWLGSLGEAGAMGYWLTFLARIGGWMTGAARETVDKKQGNTVQLTDVFADPQRQAWAKAYLDGITAWAPEFAEPYLYGGIMFYWYARDRAGAESFLERGYAQGIRRWEAPFYLAIYASRANERERAAEWIRKAAAFPEAPAIVPLLATKFLGETGNRADALAMMNALVENLPPQMEMFKETLHVERDRLVVLEALNAAAARYAERHKQRAHLIEQLIDDGLITADELAPFGGPRTFIFDGDNVVFQ